jgi:hypothetical protein
MTKYIAHVSYDQKVIVPEGQDPRELCIGEGYLDTHPGDSVLYTTFNLPTQAVVTFTKADEPLKDGYYLKYNHPYHRTTLLGEVVWQFFDKGNWVPSSLTAETEETYRTSLVYLGSGESVDS